MQGEFQAPVIRSANHNEGILPFYSVVVVFGCSVLTVNFTACMTTTTGVVASWIATVVG